MVGEYMGIHRIIPSSFVHVWKFLQQKISFIDMIWISRKNNLSQVHKQKKNDGLVGSIKDYWSSFLSLQLAALEILPA